MTLTKPFSKVYLQTSQRLVMAQPSKKDLIAEAALPLFLEFGIKGTSVDLVVKTSGVSKPTVYNHFPDKASLLLHVVERWLANQVTPSFNATTSQALFKELPKHWLTDQAIALYGLFLGDRHRAVAAATRFKQEFDQPWRAELARWAQQHPDDTAYLNERVSEKIFSALFT